VFLTFEKQEALVVKSIFQQLPDNNYCFTLLYQRRQVSKSLRWEDQGTHLYANYFKTARQVKYAGRSASQHYKKGDPEALSKDPPSAKASPTRTGSDPVVQKSRNERRANREDDLCRQQARIVLQEGVSSLSWEHRTTAPTTPGRFKVKSSGRGYETPDRGSAGPKFGDWEESNDASVSDDGFSAIFNKVREEKQSSDAPARTSGAAYNRSDQGRKYKLVSESTSNLFPCC